MPTTQLPTKKELERLYLEAARRVSQVFPAGDLGNDRESPDFLIRDEGRVLGVEVTLLCRQTEIASAARFGYVAPRAKLLYSQHVNSNPVSISPVFSPDAETMSVAELATGLAGFVYAHRHSNETFKWWRHRDQQFPKGYSQIGIFPPDERDCEGLTGTWRYFRAFSGEVASVKMLEKRIAEKNSRLVEYRKAAPEVWLLIVNDQVIGPGEVYAYPRLFAESRFDFAFDKVLVFARPLGRGGEVFELQRRQGAAANPAGA